ncbi:MAG: hypothetical protein JWO03_3646 [Bacteroidetes bacterium]|nr:hypothetical protein [Bacteroidota bacterium]
MKSITVKNILFGLVLLLAFASCSEKGKTSGADSPKSDSIAKAREDSVSNADLKDVLNAVKK